MKKETPECEWLICSDGEIDPLVKKDLNYCPFYFAYKNKDGYWWKKMDDSHNERIDEPNLYKRI